MIPGDKYRLVYCPAVTFKFLKHDKKANQFTFQMITGGTGTFSNKQVDVTTAFQFKAWELVK